jgi:hypothetical protein
VPPPAGEADLTRPVASDQIQPSAGRLRIRQPRAGLHSTAWGTEDGCGCLRRIPPNRQSAC